jgi:hypothetical protein
MHKTEHIKRYDEMTDDDFLNSVKHYRRFKHVSKYDHTLNMDYINERLNKHNLQLTEGCCNKFYINDIQK